MAEFQHQLYDGQADFTVYIYFTGIVSEGKPKEANPDVTLEKDIEFQTVLDRLVLYLRLVHSFDFYSGVEYPNEDEMPHRCGIIHARGPMPPNAVKQNEST